jgi:hypothetical protein
MSLFSKECLSRQPFQASQALKQLFSLPRSSTLNARQISNSAILRAAKKVRAPKFPTTKPKTVTSPTSKLANSQTAYKTFAEQLAEKTHPTLLYQAPSHLLFKISSYAGGFFCISYSTYNFWAHFLFPPEGINQYVIYAYGGIVVLMTALGTYLILGPARLVRTITALPRTARTTSQPIASSRINSVTASIPKPDLQLEIELRKMLPIPFFPARKILARPDEIVLAQPLAQPLPAGLTSEARRRIAEEEKQQLKALQDYEDTHIMSRPFRHFGRGAKTLYNTIARTWLRDGFVKMRVKGQGYKVDVNGGWALDNGRALDRLATVKPRTGA